MSVFEHPDFEHEEVAFVADERAGLRAIVAVHHSGAIGASGGGCRIWPYRCEADALTDVLRLSRAMSFKLALLDIPAGGAKCVVIADPREDKSPALLEALGRAVDRMAGRFVLAADVGTTPADLDVVARRTRYVMRGPSSADPTARGVLACIRESVRHALGRSELEGTSVAVQGVGEVGSRLAALLRREGARVVVADVDRGRAERVAREIGARTEPPATIHASEVDVFAPCARRRPRRAHHRRAPLLRGGGERQQPARDRRVRRRARRAGVLFAPDFVVNAGGVLGTACSCGGADEPRVEDRLVALLRSVLEQAERTGATPHAAAVAAAARAPEPLRLTEPRPSVV
ncbi:MAG: leucine dehydrogenase [Sandaracinaceae bacterium]|nr:leucine dehydrogenase [Sandaracinaceae bacterium]